MTAKEFDRFIQRDGSDYTQGQHPLSGMLVPQHRYGGMGGGKAKHRPSNVISFNSMVNGELESNYTVARIAREKGWKIEAWQDPAETPVFHALRGWVILDDNYGIRPATVAEVQAFRESLGQPTGD